VAFFAIGQLNTVVTPANLRARRSLGRVVVYLLMPVRLLHDGELQAEAGVCLRTCGGPGDP